MSPEAGGRSDKFGNEFENRCLVKYMLRLVREQLSAIIIEPSRTLLVKISISVVNSTDLIFLPFYLNSIGIFE